MFSSYFSRSIYVVLLSFVNAYKWFVLQQGGWRSDISNEGFLDLKDNSVCFLFLSQWVCVPLFLMPNSVSFCLWLKNNFFFIFCLISWDFFFGWWWLLNLHEICLTWIVTSTLARKCGSYCVELNRRWLQVLYSQTPTDFFNTSGREGSFKIVAGERNLN